MTDQTYAEVVRNIFSEVLNIPVSQIEDNTELFELGGTSIAVVQIVERMRQQLDVDISVRDLFVSPCVSELAGVVRDKKANAK